MILLGNKKNANALARKQLQNRVYSLPYIPLKNIYNPVIPLNIYQTWYTKDLPPKMLATVELLKRQNPEFKHYLYDDNECREFIKNNFPEHVLKAYDSLVPGAYKADLWRLCILYINGGIYMDIKLSCVNGFKLIELTENEHFVLDRVGIIDCFNTPKPIYNALMVCNKNNPFLLLAINKIVENVKNKYYGFSCLYPTGPGMFSELLLNKNLNVNIDLFHHEDNKYLVYKNRFVISIMYHEYHNEQSKLYKSIKTQRYPALWAEKNIYRS
jgi:mannosyltransferase OCH1-like enzyme